MLDLLNPSFIPDTSNARKVLIMTKRDEPEEESDLVKFCREKFKDEGKEEKARAAIKAINLRRKRDAVKKAKAKWELAVAAYEALRENP